MSFSLPLTVRLKRYGESFFCAWHRSADFRGASERWHFCQRPATTPTPEPHEYWLSRYYCGAQDITSTGSKHRRRNRNPAWLLAPRTAPHLGDEEGNLAKAGIFARNQEGKCSPTSRDVLVVLFSLRRALGCGRE
jgi:hypothetical protein